MNLSSGVPHEGFVESTDKNISLIRKHLSIPNLVVKNVQLGEDTNTKVTYVYIDSIADKGCCRRS